MSLLLEEIEKVMTKQTQRIHDLEEALRDMAWISRFDGKLSLRDADYCEGHLEKHPVLKAVLRTE